ncbi:dimethylaniline monooxygenase [Xylariales sp. PMI_506]|nr:dimethylaniline monooxygenase [Xylariales sp. PMI_506]
MKVAVIGAGPAGLATLKYLKTAHLYFPIAPIEVQVFEAEAEIGGTFRYRVYEDAELVSSKYLTAFSDFRFEESAPDFVTPGNYVEYLADYCTHFNLWPHIQCLTRVTKVRRNEFGHTVTVDCQGQSHNLSFDAIAVCSGLNVEPTVPTISGLDKIPMVIHSSAFKQRKQLLENFNKPTVVVLGVGETAMDLGHLAVTTPGVESVVMCHRDGFFCAPKKVPAPVVFGVWGKNVSRPPKPIDTSGASLFDTAYLHPKLQKGVALWSYYSTVVQFLTALATGTFRGMDQWVGGFSKERMNADSVFFCKSERAIPYISAKYRSKSLGHRVRAALVNMPIKDTEGRHIDLAPWPKFVDDDGIMHFEDTGSPESESMKRLVVKPDVVILATGYSRRFRFLEESSYATPNTANVRGIYREDDVSVGFIGFVRPSFGAIPPLAELQAQLWVLRLLQAKYSHDGSVSSYIKSKMRSPNAVRGYEMDYAIHARAGHDLFTERRGVDHESYAYQLALDMGAAPTFTFIYRLGFRVLWTWAMGTNFNPKFRLTGPWQDPEPALAVMRGELFNVTKRIAGIPFFLLYTLIPFVVFGTMSMSLYMWDNVKRRLGWMRDD